MRTTRIGRLCVLAVALIACSGDDVPGSTAASTTVSSADPAGSVGSVGDTPVDQPDDAPTATAAGLPDDGQADTADAADDQSAGTYDAGPVGYRVVNLLADPVDVYVRTQGFVEAFEVRAGVGPREVTELAFPPTDGSFVVTTAGAGDPECVSGCDHVIANLTALRDDGDVHTVLLYDADGPAAAFDLWEDPPPGSQNANAMVESDPATGRVVVTAVDVTDADFGLRLAFVGRSGCAEPVDSSNPLVGGNQTPAFAYDGASAEIVFHDQQDRDCAGAPVGGPFEVVGGPGSRSHLVLTGAPGDLGAVVVPFVDVSLAEPPPDDPAGDDAARSLMATELMAAELAAEIGIDLGDATCLAPFVVDAIGIDAALVDGALVDLDEADEATQRLAFEGLIVGIDECGVDRSVIGG